MAKPDLNKGVYIKLDGELGQYHTIPIDKLVAIAQSFQALINGMAKIRVNQNELELENFTIELCDLKKSSIAPAFIFSQRPTTLPILGDSHDQRKLVNEEFNKFLNLSNKGDYASLKSLYKTQEQRNEIVPLVYDFVETFENTPVRIGNFNGNKFVSGKKINKFKSDVYTRLVGAKPKTKRKKIEFEEVVGVVQVNRQTGKTKVKKYFEKGQSSLSYTLEDFILNGMTTHFNFPLTVPVVIDDELSYTIECPQLNIYVVGKDMDEVQKEFNSDFEHVYSLVYDVPDDKLGRVMKVAKKFLHLLISK